MEHKELLIKYYNNLVNSIYKLLPLYEGKKYKTSNVFYTQEEAFINFQNYLCNLLIEIHGSYQFFYSENSIKLVNILKGMIQEINLNQQTIVKRLTLECINICKKIINEIEKE